ncbi:pilus assembly protein PilZ [Glaciecola sp. MH2013]|uniref:pilus assembly PilX family protein n=1 Tax=Glaciecola sp. MH2013 TaxID=2785524 RepID=UPI0018A09273|nr:PilX N-terminal domain-containing pilus assembly protein [Glaciecola sp. MH2013]MBF7074744.1 pilus assembly protein PilZ [Glaciecola sp. MH2013]
MIKQQGLVMVFALLVLMSLTILGVASVSSGLMQTKMAASMERKSFAFDAAEAAIAGVVFESEDESLLSDPLKSDPLSEARQLNAIDLVNDELSCFDNNRIDRFITDDGLTRGRMHVDNGNFRTNPETRSWSKSAFVREEACRGSSNVIGGSNISCHIFLVRGCGQTVGSNFAVANTISAAVFAPASN